MNRYQVLGLVNCFAIYFNWMKFIFHYKFVKPEAIKVNSVGFECFHNL